MAVIHLHVCCKVLIEFHWLSSAGKSLEGLLPATLTQSTILLLVLDVSGGPEPGLLPETSPQPGCDAAAFRVLETECGDKPALGACIASCEGQRSTCVGIVSPASMMVSSFGGRLLDQISAV
jgi:hypothetical protein